MPRQQQQRHQLHLLVVLGFLFLACDAEMSNVSNQVVANANSEVQLVSAVKMSTPVHTSLVPSSAHVGPRASVDALVDVNAVARNNATDTNAAPWTSSSVVGLAASVLLLLALLVASTGRLQLASPLFFISALAWFRCFTIMANQTNDVLPLFLLLLKLFASGLLMLHPLASMLTSHAAGLGPANVFGVMLFHLSNVVSMSLVDDQTKLSALPDFASGKLYYAVAMFSFGTAFLLSAATLRSDHPTRSKMATALEIMGGGLLLAGSVIFYTSN